MPDDDHVGYVNTPVLCGTCGRTMDLSVYNRPDYEPGVPIAWIVTCANALCPHFGISYKVEPSLKLVRVAQPERASAS